MSQSSKKVSFPSMASHQQSGIVLFITLISLVIMLIASIALIRSTDVSLLVAGNLAFKRDIVNQAERAVPVIQQRFLSLSNLATDAKRQQNQISSDNYYATILPSNAQGIPNVILNASSFDTIMPSNNIVNNDAKVTVRYVIDRQCISPGAVSQNNCSLANALDISCPARICTSQLAGVPHEIYRLTIRATGPKNVEAFVQSTFKN